MRFSPTELRRKLLDARVYLIFTPALCRGDPLAVLDAALGAGADVVQLRLPGADDGAWARWSRDVREAAARRGVPLIVNDRADVATRCSADGLHVGQDDLPVEEARRLIGPDRLLGLSTHDLGQIDAAAAGGLVDYVGFGPCFDTTTKGAKGLGVDAVAAAIARASAHRMPIFPIGGIDAANAARLAKVGATAVAVSSAICSAADVAAATAAIRAAFGAR